MKQSSLLPLVIIIITAALVTAMVKPAPSIGSSQAKFIPSHSELKLEAFAILDAKCNVCHRKRNRRMVFTLENMEERAPKIHKQVFVKKRMPKGKNNILTVEESRSLRKWLISQSIY
jgi:uncharacterized membrane protein